MLSKTAQNWLKNVLKCVATRPLPRTPLGKLALTPDPLAYRLAPSVLSKKCLKNIDFQVSPTTAKFWFDALSKTFLVFNMENKTLVVTFYVSANISDFSAYKFWNSFLSSDFFVTMVFCS